MTTVTVIFWYLRLVEISSLVVASVLVALAYRGYRKSGSKAMLVGAFGFGILGVGSLIEGLLLETGVSWEEAHVFRSTLTALGLLILLYSIHETR